MSLPVKFAVLAADAVCFTLINKRLHVLLGKITNPNNPFKGKWAHVGGLIGENETSEKAIERLFGDKVGINSAFKEQLYTFSELHRDRRGRVVSVAYMMILAHTFDEERKSGSFETRWFPVDSAPKLAYDHDKMLAIAIERLQGKIEYTDIARYFLKKEFTLSELQHVFEAVLNKSLDKRNFRKKMVSLGILKVTKRVRKEGIMRPAALYFFFNTDKKQ